MRSSPIRQEDLASDAFVEAPSSFPPLPRGGEGRGEGGGRETDSAAEVAPEPSPPPSPRGRGRQRPPGRRKRELPTGRFQRRREIAVAVQGALWLGLPFLRIGGESALRLDVPTLTLHLFGAQIGLDELFPFVALSAFLLFAFAATTFLWGRVWCGYACPQTALAEITRFVTGRGNRTLRYLGVAVVSTVAAASLLWYFVPPGAFLSRLLSGNLGPALWAAWGTLAAILFLDLAFVRQVFCARVCPYARLQGLLFDGDTQVLAFDPARRGECRSCSACVAVCPVAIDLREGLHDSCIACALCADRCELVQGARGAEPSIAYSYGSPTETAGAASGPRRFRPAFLRRGAVLWPTVAAAVALASILALAGSRAPFTLTVLPDPESSTRAVPGGVEGGFLLALESHQTEPLVLELRLVGPDGPGSIEPARVELAPREYRKVPARLHLDAPPPGPHHVEVLASEPGSDAPPIRFGANLLVLETP